MRDRHGQHAVIDIVEAFAVSSCRGAVLPVVTREVERRIPEKAWDEHGARGFRAVQRVADEATGRWKALVEACEPANPPFTHAEIQAAQERFRTNPRDLSGLVTGKKKDHIPSQNDLEILVQTSKLDAPRFLVTNDANFVGYSDLLPRWYQVEVIDALQLPRLVEEWRARKT